MRTLNLTLFSNPIVSEHFAGRQMIAAFDLETDKGIVAGELKVVRDPATNERAIWSKRQAGKDLVAFDPDATAAILDLIDRATALGQFRAAA